MREKEVTSPTRRTVAPDELLELYQGIKSAETIGVFDAAEALRKDDVATALQRLQDARSRYERKHARTLARELEPPGTDRAGRKATMRRQKTLQALEQFADYVAILEKMVKIRRAVPESQPTGIGLIANSKQPNREIGVSEDLLDQLRGATDSDAAFALLDSKYGLEALRSSLDLRRGLVLFLVAKEKWHLLRSKGKDASGQVLLFDLLRNRQHRVAKEGLLRAGKQQRCWSVRQNSGAKKNVTASAEEIVLDESELLVLWSVVRDTGLLPNASEITQIQKNEFRKRQYDRVLKKMMNLQRSFTAVVRTKLAEFARELALLEAQKQSLPLREIEKRKLRINQEKRKIERAEQHFIKVMNCLHALDSRR